MDLSFILRILPDRKIMERTIFPYILERKEYQRIVFVGCRWYTRHYNSTFAGKDYCTIDIDPKQKRFGANHHIVDSLENLATHFQPNALDVIICNGVFGWGLNERLAVERAFAASFDCLRMGGMLIVGWNDVEVSEGPHDLKGKPRGFGDLFGRWLATKLMPKSARRPFSLDECRALRQFDRLDFEELGTWRYKTRSPTRHVFDFYVKGESEPRLAPSPHPS